jgi:biotin operon repressor
MEPPLGTIDPERRHLNLHISVFDVTCIETLRKRGYHVSRIAEMVGKSRATIDRVIEELKDVTPHAL